MMKQLDEQERKALNESIRSALGFQTEAQSSYMDRMFKIKRLSEDAEKALMLLNRTIRGLPDQQRLKETRDLRKLGKQLTEAEKASKAIHKIVDDTIQRATDAKMRMD